MSRRADCKSGGWRGSPAYAGWVVLLAAVLVPATGFAAPDAAAEAAKLRAVADDIYAWRLEREPAMRLSRGLPVFRLPHIDQDDAHQAAEFARSAQRRLDAIDASVLPHADDLLRQSLAHAMWVTADAERFHWLVFMVTPYQGGDVHQLAFRVLQAQPLENAAQAATYVALVREYGRILDEMRDKTVEQRRRGVLLPQPAIAGAIELCRQLQSGLPATLGLGDERLARLTPAEAGRVRAQVAKVVQSEILPRVERLQAVFDAGYRSAAPRGVGVTRYPGGAAYYRHLIRAYTGLELSAEQIHEIGKRALADIDQRLAAIRKQVGFTGTRMQFDAGLQADPRWIAHTPEEVEARYLGFIRRIEPHLPQYFSRVPKAPYAVKRLDPAAEPGMTYGYYQSPSAADPIGYYRYNGSDLEHRSLLGAQHLIYHELIPGHHFQIALEQERTTTHPLQAFLGTSAYAEGWAEYAAGLAEAMGLYEPYDLYGLLLARSFVATRLVVDTGLNALGWTLDQARQTLRANSLQSDAQIGTELLRYSTDIPGQALSYYMGYERIMELRARAQRELGPAFDLRAFNDAVLSSGNVPLNVLTSHIDWFIRAGYKQSAQHIAATNSARVHINRPPADVWPAFLDRSGWMQSIVSRQVVRGTQGATGDESLYTLRASNGAQWQRLEEILSAVPGRRMIIRAAPPDGHGSSIIADYRLTRVHGGTDVEFNVYWWEDVAERATPEELQAMEDLYSEQTQAKIQSDLQTLKQYVEARH